MFWKFRLACLAAIVFESAAVRSPPIDLALELDLDEGLDLRPALLERTADLPLCKLVAPATYPGFCSTEVSGYACYATEARYTPANRSDVVIDVQWACSPGKEVGDITTESCQQRPWEYRATTSNGTSVVEFVAHNIYKGACRLGGTDEAASPSTNASQASTPATAPSTATGSGEGEGQEEADEPDPLELLPPAEEEKEQETAPAPAPSDEASAEGQESTEEEPEESAPASTTAPSADASAEEPQEPVVATTAAATAESSATEEATEEPTPAPAPTPSPAPPAETTSKPSAAASKTTDLFSPKTPAKSASAPSPAKATAVSTTGAPNATTTGSATGRQAWTTSPIVALLLAVSGACSGRL